MQNPPPLPCTPKVFELLITRLGLACRQARVMLRGLAEAGWVPTTPWAIVPVDQEGLEDEKIQT